MREISTKKLEIGEHVMIDGVEYVAEEGSCETCLIRRESGVCGGLAVFCPINGKIEKVKKEPSYRPYRDTDEMIEDWKERFNAKDWPSYSMPLIWIWDKDKVEKMFVTGFRRQEVNTADAIIHMESLLQSYTYLDGSPCGKEEI